MTNFESLSADQFSLSLLDGVIVHFGVRFQKARAALHRDVRSICTETCHLLGWNITNAAADVISELVYKKIALYGSDLEAFAKHAKRSIINSDDVKLLVRRNPSLKAHVNKLSTNQLITKEKRRKTVALPVNRQAETPVQKPKEHEKDTPVLKPDESDRMAVDDTVDLTFD